MSNSLYVTTVEPYSGKSLVSLGLAELLLRRTKRISVFRPIIGSDSPEERDKNIDLLLRYFDLDIKYEDTYALLRQEVVDLVAHGQYDQVLDRIFQKYKYLERNYDFVLCIGTDFDEGGSYLEFDVNADIARNLGSPVLIVGSGAHRNVDTVINALRATVDAFLDRGCQVVGMIINRADPEDIAPLSKALEVVAKTHEELHDKIFLAVIPQNYVLSSPTIKEIADSLQAEVLFGEDQLDTLAYRNIIIGMQPHNFLPRLVDNALLIMPGDREELVLSVLQAHQSQNFPQIAGIVLTGGLELEPPIIRLMEGLLEVVPILFVENDTYETTTEINRVRSYITADSQVKTSLSLKLFEENVDIDALGEQIIRLKPRGLTPKMFLYNLKQQAKANKQHIVLPEGSDERILKAAEELLDQEIVDVTLLGDLEEVQTLIKKLGLHIDLDKISIIQPERSPQLRVYAETLVELRKHKGTNLERACDLMRDVSYFGTMMVYKGDADAMVSGAAHTTLHTIKPALQFVKTKPGYSVVSSVFFMCLEDRVLVYGDCAVNPDPTAEELAEIAVTSAETAQTFGVEPKVALLSYSSGESGQGEDVEKVRKATELAKQRRPDLELEGPIQYDAAVDLVVAAKKMPASKVAGRATVLIFPDLNTGNNTYKAVQRETGAIAIGPILQGLNKPVNDLSRGCTVEDIINTVVITAIQAQNAAA